MSKEVLALKYRPKKWDEVIGQDATTIILSNQIKNKTFKNGYLFVGSAGTGKTSSARLFAKEINDNQGNAIEIDAASNNSVEDVRKLVSQASIQSMDSEYKVYIIDECHSFSNTAWQAWLKILEEPPKKTIFIFCTTDAQKIPNTILSRIQRFDFKRIDTKLIKDRLLYILKEENINDYEENAIDFIAKLSAGGMRDALTTLDKVLSYDNTITLHNVMLTLGVVDYSKLFTLTKFLLENDKENIIKSVEDIYLSGVDMKYFLNQYMQFVLDLNTYLASKSFEYLTLPSSYEDEVIDIVDPRLIKLLDILVQLNFDIKYEANPKYAILASFLLSGEKLK